MSIKKQLEGFSSICLVCSFSRFMVLVACVFIVSSCAAPDDKHTGLEGSLKTDLQTSKGMLHAGELSILDYYYRLIPFKNIPVDDKIEREDAIKIKDLKNGFLRIFNDKMEGWVEIILYPREDKTPLIGYMEVACLPGCRQNVSFYEYQDGRFNNVTNMILPEMEEILKKYAGKEDFTTVPSDLWLKFPRNGTDIQVFTFKPMNSKLYEEKEVSGSQLFTLSYAEDRFLHQN